MKIKKSRALFIGRWQPFHNGHKYIIDSKLNKGIPVLIAIRDIEPDENNPLTTYQVRHCIRKVYGNMSMVKIIIIPDIESVNYGRGVGYEVNEIIVPKNIKTISGTKIREMIKAKDIIGCLMLIKI